MFMDRGTVFLIQLLVPVRSVEAVRSNLKWGNEERFREKVVTTVSVKCTTATRRHWN
jgi:hypothetical protein